MAKNELIKKEESQIVVTEVLDISEIAMDSMSNTGFENVRPEDIAIPFIKVLQAMSPQIRGTTKVKGAEESDFINTVTGAIYKEKIRVIPCAYQKAYVEWVPKEQKGGFVKQHLDSSILDSTKKDDKKRDVLPNGNIIATTAYHYCVIVNSDNTYERIVMSLSSTQLKKSRRWLSQMMSLQIDVKGKKITPPMYSHIYEVTTTEESNDAGTWYGYVFGNSEIIKDKDLYLYAKKFSEDIKGGAVKVSEPIDSDIITENMTQNVDTSSVSDKF